MPSKTIAVFFGISLLFLACSKKATPPSNSPNHPPNMPQALAPADSAVDVQTDANLFWQCSDEDGDALRYALFFGMQPDPPLADTGLTANIFYPDPLEFNTAYYWKIIAFDEHGDSTAGPIWSFRTVSITGIQLLGSMDLPSGRWGYDVSPKSIVNNYIYMAGSYTPLYIYDMEDPSNPTLAGQYGDGRLSIRKMAVLDQLAYLVETEDSLRSYYNIEIVDISSYTSPVQIASVTFGGIFGSMTMRGNYAYLVSTTGIITLDISNPVNPVPIDTSDGWAGSLRFVGDYAYSFENCAEIPEIRCLNCYEIHDNITFELINTTRFYSADGGFLIDNQHLYLSDMRNLIIYSIIPPGDPQFIYNFVPDSSSSSFFYGFQIKGTLLYTNGFHYPGGYIIIFDITDILNPREIVSYTSQTGIEGICLANNRIYAFDNTHRLLILGYTD